MRTLTIRRIGSFTQKRTGTAKCGSPNKMLYSYRCSITVRRKNHDGQPALRKPDYFIVDNQTIHEYFLDKYTRATKPNQSCELMADQAVSHIYRLLRNQRPWLQVQDITVEISGSEWESGLRSTWTAS